MLICFSFLAICWFHVNLLSIVILRYLISVFRGIWISLMVTSGVGTFPKGESHGARFIFIYSYTPLLKPVFQSIKVILKVGCCSSWVFVNWQYDGVAIPRCRRGPNRSGWKRCNRKLSACLIERRLTYGLHGAISHTMSTLITTAVRTSNLI
jgi:hypothetical protein